jgi:heme/copper-type cytochrome/quinol oxidase subunit 4
MTAHKRRWSLLSTIFVLAMAIAILLGGATWAMNAGNIRGLILGKPLPEGYMPPIY